MIFVAFLVLLRSFLFLSIVCYSLKFREERTTQRTNNSFYDMWLVFLWNGYVYVIANILDFYDFTLDFEPCDLLWFFLDKKIRIFFWNFFFEKDGFFILFLKKQYKYVSNFNLFYEFRLKIDSKICEREGHIFGTQKIFQ